MTVSANTTPPDLDAALARVRQVLIGLRAQEVQILRALEATEEAQCAADLSERALLEDLRQRSCRLQDDLVRITGNRFDLYDFGRLEAGNVWYQNAADHAAEHRREAAERRARFGVAP